MNNVSRRAGNTSKELRRLLSQPFLAGTILLILASLGIFVLFPMFKTLQSAFTDADGLLSLNALRKVLTNRGYQQTFLNSMKLAAVVSVLSTAVGYVLAFAVTRTEIPGKKIFNALVQLPIISPPFILALSVIFLFGRQGLITKELLGISGNDVYGFRSLVVIQVISFFPVAFLTLTGILSSIDSSVEDAAMNMGASRWRIFRTVTLPLSMPGVISAALLTFVQSLEDFSNPAVIGGGFSTLAVETYRTIIGMYDLHTGAALAVILLLPTVCAFMLQRYWLGKRSFVTVTGKPVQQTRKLHGSGMWLLFAVCLLISGGIILLYGTVLVGAFAKIWGVDFSFSLSHFRYAWDYGRDALLNSLKLALIAAPVTGFLGIAIAFLTSRRRFPGRKIMQVSSLLTFAIPGTVLGLSYVSAFNTRPFLLTGTALILVAAFVFRNMSVAIESGSSTLLQIDPSIEEASTILGADNGLTFRKIILPLLKQPFFAGIVFSFVRSVTAVSTVIFLTSPRWPLVTNKVYGLFEISKYSDAAALVVIMIAVILLVTAVISLCVQAILKPRAKSM